MKTKFSKYLFTASLVAVLATTGCTWGNSDNQSSGIDSDSVKLPIDSIDVNGDSMWLYRGIIVDGSRSNINLKFYDDTLDFEIPSDMDFTYEVGDSVSILIKADSNGSDSIAEIQNWGTEN